DKVRIPHRGYAAWMVESGVRHLAKELTEAFTQRERWRSIVLKQDERLAFADAAIPLRFDCQKFAVDPDDLLRPRRSEQATGSLWHVLNSVHENIMRGGIPQRRSDGSRIRSRPVIRVEEEVWVNRSLWQLAAALERAIN